MKHLISFETDLFNSTESKPHFINYRCFGEDLIAWIIANFSDQTFVLDEPFQEDWGWATLARRENETFLIGAGIMDESIGEVPAEWIVIVEKMRRFMIFGSKKSRNLAVIANNLEEVFQKADGIVNVRHSIENQLFARQYLSPLILIEINKTGNAVSFTVRVVPRASKTEFAGELEGAVKVRVASPPVDGAANAELIKLFAKTLGVGKSDVEIVSGQTSKTKQIRITGVTAEQLKNAIG